MQGFQTTDPLRGRHGHDVDVKLWVDVKTWLPVRVEMKIKMNEQMETEATLAMTSSGMSPVEAAQFNPVFRRTSPPLRATGSRCHR